MKCKVLVPNQLAKPEEATLAITLRAESAKEQAALAWLTRAVMRSGTMVCHAGNQAAQIKFTTGEGDVEFTSLPLPLPSQREEDTDVT